MHLSFYCVSQGSNSSHHAWHSRYLCLLSSASGFFETRPLIWLDWLTSLSRSRGGSAPLRLGVAQAQLFTHWWGSSLRFSCLSSSSTTVSQLLAPWLFGPTSPVNFSSSGHTASSVFILGYLNESASCSELSSTSHSLRLISYAHPWTCKPRCFIRLFFLSQQHLSFWKAQLVHLQDVQELVVSHCWSSSYWADVSLSLVSSLFFFPEWNPQALPWLPLPILHLSLQPLQLHRTGSLATFMLSIISSSSNRTLTCANFLSGTDSMHSYPHTIICLLVALYFSLQMQHS